MKKLLLFALTAALVSGCGQPAQPPTATSSPSQAATSSPSPGDREGRRRGFDPERFKAELDLTDEQMTELQPIFEAQKEQAKKRMDDFRAAMDKVLTKEQKAKLATLTADPKKNRRIPYEELDLTGPQATQLEDLRQKMRDQGVKEREAFMEKLSQNLTPEQRKKLETMQSRRRDRERE